MMFEKKRVRKWKGLERMVDLGKREERYGSGMCMIWWIWLWFCRL